MKKHEYHDGFTVEKTGQVDEFGFPVLVKKPADNGAVSEPTPASDAERREFDAAKFALEAATGGKNTLIHDDLGQPSVMVRIPAFKWSDVIDGAPDELCSAFIAGGKKLPCVYISKFLNVIENGRAYSLPNREPEHTLAIDEAREACSRKGRGWHLFTNAEWAAIAHWCRKNGTIPHGNTRYGSDVYAQHEAAVAAESWLYERDLVDVPRPDGAERTLSGSGPASWSHDGTDSGIFDLTGNVWDWVSGVRIVDGEIQVIPDNDSALNTDESPESTAWRAISVDGSLVAPGSPNTFKYDGVAPGRSDGQNVGVQGGVQLNTVVNNFQYTGDAEDKKHLAYTFMAFDAMQSAPKVEPHFLLKALGLYPISDKLGRDPEWLFIRNYGERVAARGSSWIGGSGFWYLYLRESREFIYPDIGFRSAWIDA
ncbi:MAG: hypothetical protein LBN30_01205 [Oscillospiraceae bacterium]|jgi:hypothetical protein|nr:hypothetical protein [Oscillospiraceae bacterium]